jgi:hypothetical protein
MSPVAGTGWYASDMKKPGSKSLTPRTHFEQVPLERVRKTVVEKRTPKTRGPYPALVREPPMRKTEPYSIQTWDVRS